MDNFFYEHDGTFVIIDILLGVDIDEDYDINKYKDVYKKLIGKYRELAKEFNSTIVILHHLGKQNTTLGSTALEGAVDGTITLFKDDNVKNKVLLSYEGRDYADLELVLRRNEDLHFEIVEESKELNINLISFLNYAIEKKEFEFTCSEMTSKLKLQIIPSTFGRLLNSNIENLQKEGLSIIDCRNSEGRFYKAKFVEADNDN